MNNGVNDTLSVIEDVLTEARTIIANEASDDGKKGVRIMDLCARVGDKIGKTDAEMYHLIKMLLENCPDLEVRRGRSGGIYKKPAVAQVDSSAQNTTVQQ